MDRLAQAIDTRGAARIALAGGGTPRPLYRLLAQRMAQAGMPVLPQLIVEAGDEVRVGQHLLKKECDFFYRYNASRRAH